jgi:hypothetical protein
MKRLSTDLVFVAGLTLGLLAVWNIYTILLTSTFNPSICNKAAISMKVDKDKQHRGSGRKG